MTRSKCSMCGVKFESDDVLSSHYYSAHKATHCCRYCRDQFANQTDLYKHIQERHHSGDPIKCDFCDFVNRGDLAGFFVHIKSAHPTLVKKFGCRKCSYVAFSAAALDNHMKYFVHGLETPSAEGSSSEDYDEDEDIYAVRRPLKAPRMSQVFGNEGIKMSPDTMSGVSARVIGTDKSRRSVSELEKPAGDRLLSNKSSGSTNHVKDFLTTDRSDFNLSSATTKPGSKTASNSSANGASGSGNPNSLLYCCLLCGSSTQYKFNMKKHIIKGHNCMESTWVNNFRTMERPAESDLDRSDDSDDTSSATTRETSASCAHSNYKTLKRKSSTFSAQTDLPCPDCQKNRQTRDDLLDQLQKSRKLLGKVLAGLSKV